MPARCLQTRLALTAAVPAQLWLREQQLRSAATQLRLGWLLWLGCQKQPPRRMDRMLTGLQRVRLRLRLQRGQQQVRLLLAELVLVTPHLATLHQLLQTHPSQQSLQQQTLPPLAPVSAAAAAQAAAG